MNYREQVRKHYWQNREDGLRPSQALLSAKHDAKYGPHSNKLDIFESRYGAYGGTQRTTLPNGWILEVKFQQDGDYGPPWEDCDGMGVIEESREHPGPDYEDWILSSDRWWYRYFDWKATLPEAIKDGWNAKPYNDGVPGRERAMKAMRSTYKYLRRWHCQDWWYVGMIVRLLDEDEKELAEDSCWGYESDNMDYLCSEARSWAASMIRAERKARRDQARQIKIESRFQEAMECGV